MENLKQIWSCQISTSEKDGVSKLRQITVRECDNLTNLFPRNPLPLLNHLEEVEVKKCGSIEVLFDIDFESVCKIGKHTNSRLRKIEVVRLSKLKELWRMKGVNESHTLVNHFKGVQTIHIEECGNFTDIFTPTSTNFDLGALTSYYSAHNSEDLKGRERRNEMNESDQEINVMSEVDDYIRDITYPSYLLHTCHHLQHLKLDSDERVEKVVFDMDSQSNTQLATIQPSLLVPYLQSIKLWELEEASHVWKCNWNKFLIPHHPPFQNLTDFTLGCCPKIKYLLSPLMAKYLSNLKNVSLIWCEGIEQVISSRDDENATSTSSHQNTTFFPHFDTLKLLDLSCLKCIDDDKITWSRSNKISSGITNTIHDHYQSAQVTGSYWSLCQYPRKITIWRCDALSSLIPWYAAGQMKRLQELEIKLCSRMTKVFENEGSGAGTSLTSLPLKNSTTVVVPQLSNLTTVGIYECDLLPHIFTFSTLKTLSHLKELKVKRCETIQVIVKEENKTSSEEEEVVVFPNLETLELDRLPNLKGFFLGMKDFQCPSLVTVMINDCPQWVAFTSGQLETPKLKYIHTSFGKHSLEHGFNFQTTFPTSSKGMPSSFHNLIEINIENKEDVGRTIIPSNELLQLVKLQQINVKSCDRVKEVFEVVAVEGSGSSESKTVVPIPNLTQMNLSSVFNLKYLWKSNQRMVLEFPNLTTLSIYHCENLKHVFTCSMVGSLVQLQELSISDCWDMEVIVKEEEEEEECDVKVNEIILPRLNSLKLQHLWDLKGFFLGKEAFSLPALDTLQIKDCSNVTVFTKGHLFTPQLKVIDTDFGICDVRTDVNSFIETKLEEGHNFFAGT